MVKKVTAGVCLDSFPKGRELQISHLQQLEGLRVSSRDSRGKEALAELSPATRKPVRLVSV